MLKKIKKLVEKEINNYCRGMEKEYALGDISPLLFRQIKEFITREGKRVRPLLFVLGYLGFSKKTAPGLLRSAISIELLHDFMLVHDDIIDKSDTRRGKPSMHKLFGNYLTGYPQAKFSGEDLSIVAGDVMFAMGMDAFLSVREDKARKEAALKQLIRAALYTGAGEFIELLYGVKGAEEIKREDIYKIYDYKTAYYTFSSPLAIGAILGGASKEEANKLIKYGIYLGRAFQIKDDILGMFGDEKKIGKSTLTDLQEAKKTILIWYAFSRSGPANRKIIKEVMNKTLVTRDDLKRIRKIIEESQAIDYARKEVNLSIQKAKILLVSSKLKQSYKSALQQYSGEILSV